MKWKFNLPEYSVLLYYFVKFTGLTPFIVKNNSFHPPTLLGKLYSVFLAAGYFLFMAILFIPAMEKLYTADHSLFSKIWNTILYFISVFISLTPIIFLWMQRKIIHLMNKLCTISKELKRLGIEEDSEIYFKDRFVTTLMANTINIATYVIQFLLKPQSFNLMAMKIYIDSWFSLNTVLIFAQLLLCIRQRFIFVNEKLYDLLTPAVHHRFSHCARVFVVSRDASEENASRRNSFTDRQRIQKIQILHLQICDLVDGTTYLFATPILLNIFGYFTQLVILFYWMYSALQNSGQSSITDIFFSIMRIVILIAQLFIIAHPSVTACQQGNATRAVLSKVWIKFRPRELTNKFVEFSHQLQHRPLTVSAFGIVDLNYSLIIKVLCTLITYLIIMIQFETA